MQVLETCSTQTGEDSCASFVSSLWTYYDDDERDIADDDADVDPECMWITRDNSQCQP
jgi:hypothetical protein